MTILSYKHLNRGGWRKFADKSVCHRKHSFPSAQSPTLDAQANVTEERERWIGDDDIGFLEEFDAFGRAEVAVAVEAGEDVLAVLDEVFDVGDVNRAVAVLVTNFGDNDLVGASFVARFGIVRRARRARPTTSATLRLCVKLFPEQVQLRVGDGRAVVAGGDELLQSEVVEARGEVVEEVAFIGIVAVAEHGLSLEKARVVLQLRLDVAELRVKLVLLRVLRVA